MTDSSHGLPCWYELMTTDLDAAQGFYGALMGWTVTDAGMPGFDYRLAAAAGTFGTRHGSESPASTGFRKGAASGASAMPARSSSSARTRLTPSRLLNASTSAAGKGV